MLMLMACINTTSSFVEGIFGFLLGFLAVGGRISPQAYLRHCHPRPGGESNLDYWGSLTGKNPKINPFLFARF